MTVTKHELIDIIQRELGVGGTPVSKTQVAAVLEQLGTVVARALAADHEVTLPGLGKLKPHQRAARTGRNPQTGAAIEIPAKRLVKLSTAKTLDDHLNA